MVQWLDYSLNRTYYGLQLEITQLAIFSITETRLDKLDDILQLLPCRNESDLSSSEINYLSMKFKVRLGQHI